jgi:hypothetical protein
MAAWGEMFPDRKPRVLQPVTPIEHPFAEIGRFRYLSGTFFTGCDDLMLDLFVEPFTDRFLVSSMAMRIRLEKLGLLYREVPHPSVLAGRA